MVKMLKYLKVLVKDVDHHLISYVNAIDRKNINKIKILSKQYIIDNNSNKNKKDIVYEMYNKNLLTKKRLKFIVENCTKYMSISSLLVKRLIKENNIEFFSIILENTNFFDNEFILNILLNNYKNKIPISTSDLNQQISKYTIFQNISYDNVDEYLFRACLSENKYMVKYLVEHGVDINKQTELDETPLFNACLNGNEYIFKYLVEHGADINKQNVLGETPLFNACKSGNEHIFNYLVEHGADIYINQSNGETLLFNACEGENENIIKYLVEHEVDMNKQNIWNGETPLLKACENGNENIVKYLVDHGADVNKPNKNGQTPLVIACLNKNENIVKYLIEHGANITNINPEENNYKNPLLNSCIYVNKNVINYLIEQGANI